MNKHDAVEILEKLLHELDNIPAYNPFEANPEFDKWQKRVLRNIENIFPNASVKIHEFLHIKFKYSGYRGFDGLTVPMDEKTFKNGCKTAKAFLESCIEEITEENVITGNKQKKDFLSFEDLLHPIIAKEPYALYKNEHYRDAVLNSIISVFDLIRHRAETDEDGARLIGKVFSTDNPKIILSNLDSESGKNDQKGFMQIFMGAYQGIRNPKAHSLTHNLTPIKAAQYLIFASLLARRIEESIVVE